MSKVITRLVTAMALLALVAVPTAIGNGAANTGLWTSSHRGGATTCSFSGPDANGFCYIDDAGAVELGVKFTSSSAALITGVRVYRTDAGAVTGSLWAADGIRLAGATSFSGTATHSWQDVLFTTPVTITPNTTYVASYFAPNADYAYTHDYFTNHSETFGPITALESVTGNPNGVYCYVGELCAGFPTYSFRGSNYWVTPLWVANQPPTVDAGGPYSVNEGSSVLVSATGNDPDGEALTYAWDLDNDATFETPGQSATFSAAAIDGPATQTIGNQATDPGGLSATATATVNILNVAPVVTAFTCPVNPVALNTAATLTGAFTDAGTADTHTASIAWDDGSPSTAGTVTEASGSGTASGSKTYTAVGIYSPTLEVIDDDGGSASANCDYVVVYDPNGGFVTGGGWIMSPAGAYAADPSLTGKATFGFVSKYLKGATVPSGKTEFQFHASGMNFQSTSYEWLVVNGSAGSYVGQFKGTGTINGSGPYKFMVWAGDKSTGDTLRIRIWQESGGVETVDYDNGTAQVIGGGSIVVHKK